METGKVEYAPDYKSQVRMAMDEGRRIAESVIAQNKVTAEHARLKDAVVEAAKAYGRAARAVEDHMKKATESDSESAAGWQLLRDMESKMEDLMLEAVWPLIDFEAKQSAGVG